MQHKKAAWRGHAGPGPEEHAQGHVQGYGQHLPPQQGAMEAGQGASPGPVREQQAGQAGSEARPGAGLFRGRTKSITGLPLRQPSHAGGGDAGARGHCSEGAGEREGGELQVLAAMRGIRGALQHALRGAAAAAAEGQGWEADVEGAGAGDCLQLLAQLQQQLRAGAGI